MQRPIDTLISLGWKFILLPALAMVQAEEVEPLPRAEPVSAAESADSFRLLNGFRMELLAAEPLVTDPVAMQYDEDGLAYVVEMNDYPYTDTTLDVAWKEQSSASIGRIRILEDTDNDGRFDKSTVFAEGLSWPTGIAFWKGGVFVTATPDVWYLKDTDGDRRADVRRKVLTGFRKFNVQAVMNNLAWGLDHRIYAAGSSNGGDIRSSDESNKPIRMRRSDFRIDPRTEIFEVLSGGARFGNTFDDFGNRFICNIRNPVQHVVLRQRYLARNPHMPVPKGVHDAAPAGDAIEVFRMSPPEPWRVLNAARLASDSSRKSPRSEMTATGYVTSSSGITVYRGAAYPATYYGNAFVCEVAGNLIMRYSLEAKGPTFLATRVVDRQEFIASTDNWCRPVNFVNAPDGTLHVLDMYRETIEHPWSIPDDIKARLDLQSGRDRGRIYRLAPPEYPAGYPTNRQPRLGSATVEKLVIELENPNCWWRETAHRLIFERQDRAAIGPLRALLANSKNPLARLHSLWSLEGMDSLSNADLQVGLTDASPRVREQAVRLAEARLNDSEDLLNRVILLSTDSDIRVRFQVAFSLGEYDGSLSDTVIRALADILANDGGNTWMRIAVLSSLAGQEAELAGKLVHNISFVASAPASAVISALAEIVGARGQQDEINWLFESLESAPEVALPSVVALGTGLRRARKQLDLKNSLVTRLFAQAEQVVADTDAKLDERLSFLELLEFQSLARAEPFLLELLDAREPQHLQTAAIDALGRFSDDRIAPLLLDSYSQLTPTVRTAMIDVLLARSERISPLLNAIEEGRIARVEISAVQRRLLSRNRDEKIRKRIADLFADDAPSPRDEVIAAYQQALELTGDIANGEKVFRRECIGCHRFGKEGHDVGINLATVKNRTASEVLVHVLDPNREVSPNFFEYIVVTNDGRTSTGVIAAETATSITLRQAKGKQKTILRNNIEEIASSDVSLMPEGLEKKITIPEMADLLTFLLELKFE
ncbi:MAG: PVC-type heme-binding CxxCH protein [Pirellulales bacterium]